MPDDLQFTDNTTPQVTASFSDGLGLPSSEDMVQALNAPDTVSLDPDAGTHTSWTSLAVPAVRGGRALLNKGLQVYHAAKPVIDTVRQNIPVVANEVKQDVSNKAQEAVENAGKKIIPHREDRYTRGFWPLMVDVFNGDWEELRKDSKELGTVMGVKTGLNTALGTTNLGGGNPNWYAFRHDPGTPWYRMPAIGGAPPLKDYGLYSADTLPQQPGPWQRRYQTLRNIFGYGPRPTTSFGTTVNVAQPEVSYSLPVDTGNFSAFPYQSAMAEAPGQAAQEFAYAQYPKGTGNPSLTSRSTQFVKDKASRYRPKFFDNDGFFSRHINPLKPVSNEFRQLAAQMPLEALAMPAATGTATAPAIVPNVAMAGAAPTLPRGVTSKAPIGMTDGVVTTSTADLASSPFGIRNSAEMVTAPGAGAFQADTTLAGSPALASKPVTGMAPSYTEAQAAAVANPSKIRPLISRSGAPLQTSPLEITTVPKNPKLTRSWGKWGLNTAAGTVPALLQYMAFDAGNIVGSDLGENMQQKEPNVTATDQALFDFTGRYLSPGANQNLYTAVNLPGAYLSSLTLPNIYESAGNIATDLATTPYDLARGIYNFPYSNIGLAAKYFPGMLAEGVGRTLYDVGDTLFNFEHHNNPMVNPFDKWKFDWRHPRQSRLELQKIIRESPYWGNIDRVNRRDPVYFDELGVPITSLSPKEYSDDEVWAKIMKDARALGPNLVKFYGDELGTSLLEFQDHLLRDPEAFRRYLDELGVDKFGKNLPPEVRQMMKDRMYNQFVQISDKISSGDLFPDMPRAKDWSEMGFMETMASRFLHNMYKLKQERLGIEPLPLDKWREATMVPKQLDYMYNQTRNYLRGLYQNKLYRPLFNTEWGKELNYIYDFMQE